MRPALLAWLLVVVFVAGAVSTAAAGFDPTPWRLRTAVLNLVAQRLEAIDGRLQAVPSNPPDPWTVPRLNIIALQLQVQEGIVEAVLSTPPDPFTPPEFFEALANVGAGAAGIAEPAASGWDDPPEDPRVREALAGVQQGAQDIVNAVDAYGGGIS